MYQDLHYKFIERLRRDSNYKKWCWGKESNPRPPDYKSDALPTELPQHGGLNTLKYFKSRLLNDTKNHRFENIRIS